MIKHCQKFHFRIFRHGFLISKHARAGRHGILAPALKAETSIYQFLLFDLSASWSVGELSSYHEKPPAMRRLNPQLRSIQVNCAVSLFDE